MPKTAADKAHFLRNPSAFQKHQLCRTLWEKQEGILRAVETSPLVAVKGCHASGKTFAAAGLPLWWLVRYSNGKVFTTAPTLRQVKAFWKDINTARAGGPVGQLLPESTSVGLEISPSRYAFGTSSSAGINIQGLHGSNVLIVADEAPGIDSDIWDAIEGIRAGGNVHLLELGNPVVPVGHFHDSFTRNRAIYNCISISAFDTPNLQNPATQKPLTFEELLGMSEEELDWAPFPFLITRRWVRERYLTWGPNHPKFRSRVMAEFPTQSPYAVFELSWIERAKREPTAHELERARVLSVQVGIDVAGPGDDETALCARVGGIILLQMAWHEADPLGPVLKILHTLRTHPTYRLGSIVVDTTGIGYHFARRLVERGFSVYGFVAQQRAVDAEQFVNGKSEAYFRAREYFKTGQISGLEDEECEAQLSTMLYHETSRGLTEIRSKDYMRREMQVPSPDRAEALIFSFMKVIPREQTVIFGGIDSCQISPI